jgi:Bifunctional DNA primase/polymerase, N-terminal
MMTTIPTRTPARRCHVKLSRTCNTIFGRAQAQSGAEAIKECGGTDLLDAGLRAAKRGWRIFLCDGSKKPLVKHWREEATTDEATIKAWAKQWPGAMWARALPADVLLIDLDLKHGRNGVREFRQLQG